MRAIIILTAVTLLSAPAVSGKIGCRKANGQIAKASDCATAAPASAEIVKGKDGRCRWARKGTGHNGGQTVKCP